MSSDEFNKKTVCLKLAKNGIYLYKNPIANEVKFLKPGYANNKDSSKIARIHPLPENSCNKDFIHRKMCREVNEETVLQKFIRGFDCEDFSDDSLIADDVQIVADHSASALNKTKEKKLSSNKFYMKSNKNYLVKHPSPKCKVEFVSLSDANSSKSDVCPLVVDLSRKQSIREPVKISKSDLRSLNRNFITPKIKVENFSSHSDMTSLPLIISAPDTPMGNSSPRSPYPSTKIEIDFTGSSIQFDPLRSQQITTQGFSSSEMASSDFGNQNPNLEYSDKYGACSDKRSVLSQDVKHYANTEPVINQDTPWEVIDAARQLYWKRTRTLLQWMRPQSASGSVIKTTLDLAWTRLPNWQKQIYIDQVVGKCGSDTVSPMVNPQILDMAAHESWSDKRLPDTSSSQPVVKKRKYTKKPVNSQISSPASLYNFFSSL